MPQPKLKQIEERCPYAANVLWVFDHPSDSHPEYIVECTCWDHFDNLKNNGYVMAKMGEVGRCAPVWKKIIKTFDGLKNETRVLKKFGFASRNIKVTVA